MEPGRVNVFAPTLAVRVPPLSTTPPVPALRFWLPRKFRSAAQIWGLLLVQTLLTTVVSSVPPCSVKVPVPKAALSPSTSFPATSVSPPARVLALVSDKVPAPIFVKAPAPERPVAKETVLPFRSRLALAPALMGAKRLERSVVIPAA